MNKRPQDGLFIDNSFFVIDEKKTDFPLTARIVQFIAVFVCCWSSITVLIDSLQIPVNVLQIYFSLLIFSGIAFGLCLLPSYDLVKLFFGMFFYGLFFYSRFPRLQNGFYILENLVIDRLASYYNYQTLYFVAEYGTAAKDTTLLVIMTMIPMVVLASVAIVRNRYANISSIILFIPITISFLLGIIPSEACLIAYVASVLYLTKSGYSGHHIVDKTQKNVLHRISSRSAVWLSLLSIFLFFFLKLFISEEKYDNITEIKEMKKTIQTTLNETSINDVNKYFKKIHINGNSIAVGGLSGGKLGKTGSVEYNNSDQLVITAPRNSLEEGIYLKGYVGSEYTGDSWEPHSKRNEAKYQQLLKRLPDEAFSPVNQMADFIDRSIEQRSTDFEGTSAQFYNTFILFNGKLNIKYIEANKRYLYTPYFTDYGLLTDEAYSKLDLYAAPKRQEDSYGFNYYYSFKIESQPESFMNGLETSLGDYTKYEKLYRKFVNDVYTQMPEGLEQLKQDFSEENLPEDVDDSITGRIDYIKHYLWQNTSYSLKPGKLPKGKDFVEYFLYENKVGYCAHYASAATLMLRAMGIPARYVEGYAIGGAGTETETVDSNYPTTVFSATGEIVTSLEQVRFTVKDYNAHAWVEVYIDGCGWIPVEFTPASSVSFDDEIMDGLSQVRDNMGEEEVDELVPSQAPNQPDRDWKDANETQKEETSPQEKVESVEKKAEQNKLNRIFTVVFICLVSFALVAFLYIRVSHKRRLRHSRNRNRRAIFLFAEMEKILGICHALPNRRDRLEDSVEYVKENCKLIDSNLFDECMEIVKKARFAKGRITPQEVIMVEKLHHKLLFEAEKDLPMHRKLYMRILLFI